MGKIQFNNRLVKMILGIAGALVVGGYVLVFHLSLEEPVFFDHYYELQFIEEEERLTSESHLTFHYVTNSHDERVVTGMEFPELMEGSFLSSEFEQPDGVFRGIEQSPDEIPERLYGRYSVREVFVHIPGAVLDYEDVKGAVLTEALVHFSDGSSLVLDVGELHVGTQRAEKAPMDTVNTEETTDATSETHFRALEDLTLSSIEEDLLEELDDRVDLTINGTDYSEVEGMTIEEGETLHVVVDIHHEEEDYTLFELYPELIFIGEDGTEYSRTIYNVNQTHPTYSFSGLYQYLREREGI